MTAEPKRIHRRAPRVDRAGEPDPVQLGRRLRARRIARGFTQSEVGTALGLTRTAITSIEAGKQGVTLASAIALADLFRLSLNELVGVDVKNRDDADVFEPGYRSGYADAIDVARRAVCGLSTSL